MQVRMVTILRPTFKGMVNNRRVTPTLNDYVTVPYLATIGTFPLVQMLPMVTLAALAVKYPVRRNAREDGKR